MVCISKIQDKNVARSQRRGSVFSLGHSATVV